MKDIKNQFKKNLFKFNFEGNLPSDIQEKAEIVTQGDHSLTIKLDKADDAKTFLRYLVQQNLHITAFNEVLPTLNEIFIQQVEAESN